MMQPNIKYQDSCQKNCVKKNKNRTKRSLANYMYVYIINILMKDVSMKLKKQSALLHFQVK